MAFRATTALKYANKPIPVGEKYTVQSTGIWESIRRVFAVDATRSNGVPLNPQFRNPPPGALAPTTYDDPVTVPAGDIADNAYWKRDMRRSYARPSVVKQSDVVGLLTVGNAAKPVEGALGSGEEGQKQLVKVREEGEEKGLAGWFEEKAGGVEGVRRAVLTGEGGVLPPTPVGLNHLERKKGDKGYVMLEKAEQAYSEDYPCRTFV